MRSKIETEVIRNFFFLFIHSVSSYHSWTGWNGGNA